MPYALLPIQCGLHRMRNGSHALITEMGCFAYGRLENGVEDFWRFEDGSHAGADGPSDLDLVERLTPREVE